MVFPLEFTVTVFRGISSNGLTVSAGVRRLLFAFLLRHIFVFTPKTSARQTNPIMIPVTVTARIAEITKLVQSFSFKCLINQLTN